MFHAKTAELPPLSPRDYSDPRVDQEELRAVFARSWNVVCAASALAEDGAQLAVEVGDVPVLVRNEGGVLRAYRNVCPHRHALLARPGKSCASSLKCQYHGWEFSPAGKLCKLPDGPAFVGWKARDVRLESLRCETAFGLVFVHPGADDGTLAADWRGIYPALAAQSADFSLRYVQVSEHDVNWKVVVENAVESYHVPLVHPGTFGNYQDEAFHEHVIDPAYTKFHDLTSTPSRRWQLLDRALFSPSCLHGYSHVHLFPNHLVSWAGFYREWVVIEPLGPRRCRRVGYGFFPSRLRPGVPMARALLWELARRTRRSADRILAEDASVWPSVQRGSEASAFRGVLSRREERVAAFQRWVMERRAELDRAPSQQR